MGVERWAPPHVTAPDEAALCPGSDNDLEDATTVVGHRDEAGPGWPVVIFIFVDVLWHVQGPPLVTPVEPSGDHPLCGSIVEGKWAGSTRKDCWICIDQESVARPGTSAVDFAEEDTQLAGKLDTKTGFEVGELPRVEARPLDISMTIWFPRTKDLPGDIEARKLVELRSNGVHAFRN